MPFFEQLLTTLLWTVNNIAFKNSCRKCLCILKIVVPEKIGKFVEGGKKPVILRRMALICQSLHHVILSDQTGCVTAIEITQN